LQRAGKADQTIGLRFALVGGPGRVIARFICRFIGHRRSGRLAHVVKGRWHSRCKRCGVELVRVAPENWQEPSEAA